MAPAPLLGQLYYEISNEFGLPFSELASDSTLRKYVNKSVMRRWGECSSFQNTESLKYALGKKCWDYLYKNSRLAAINHLLSGHHQYIAQQHPKHPSSQNPKTSKLTCLGKSLLLRFGFLQRFVSVLWRQSVRKIPNQQIGVERLMCSCGANWPNDQAERPGTKDAPLANEDAKPGSLQRFVRLGRIYIQMFLYKCKGVSFVHSSPTESTIVPLTPLEYVALHNNENLWQLADTLGTGKLRGWVSPELGPHPPPTLKTLFRPTSDGKWEWIGDVSCDVKKPNDKS